LGYTDNGGEFWKPPLGKPAPDLQAELDATNKQVEILSDALAESRREVAALKAVQEPVLKPLSKKWKWVLHESFADVAGFDEEGIPSFYWKESVTKFKSGELSVPCKGKNCGSMNGWLHSAECRAEHEAQYTTPPAQPAPVQEPVAWMAESKNGNVRFTNIGQSADQLESFGWTIFPLYAAPFQFQPLTEEAVLECWKQVYEPGRREHDNATRMARAIEAAHGITKKGQP
jgi:hypothetical protein